MMRNLFVRRSMLWPRFDITVSKSLEAKKPEVVELEVGMTESMREIQIAILECIEASISELRKTNSQHLELEDWTVDSALHKNFDVIIRRQLDPVWHRVSYKTRQIVSDLTQFRDLLQYVPGHICELCASNRLTVALSCQKIVLISIKVWRIFWQPIHRSQVQHAKRRLHGFSSMLRIPYSVWQKDVYTQRV